MDYTVKNNTITAKHTLKKDETFKLSKGDSIQSFTVYKKPQMVSGYSNVCEDNMQILTLDYDNVDISVVEEDYRYLQENFCLSDGFVFKTTKGFHVVCLDKHKPSNIYDLLRYTRIDENYRDMPLRNPYRSYVLRLSPKKGGKRPKFVKMVGKHSKCDPQYDTSSAHLNLLKKLYPQLKISKYFRLDKLKKVRLTAYETK